MMTPRKLFITERSPFARRVRLALRHRGVTVEEVKVDVFNPSEEFLQMAPLGMVPVLELESGKVLYDSEAILDFIDETIAPVWPQVKHEAARGSAQSLFRQEVRALSTLVEGTILATVQIVVENMRKYPSKGFLNDYLDTIQRAVKKMCVAPQGWFDASGALTQAGWDLGVCLQYLELRVPSYNWREVGGERFLKVLALCEESQAFRETAPPPVPVAN